MEATHVHCFEDDTYTEIADGDTADVTPCAQCDDNGKDAFCVEPVAIVPCPNGVTVADWRSGFTSGKHCDDDDHEFRSGNHVIDLAR